MLWDKVLPRKNLQFLEGNNSLKSKAEVILSTKHAKLYALQTVHPHKNKWCLKSALLSTRSQSLLGTGQVLTTPFGWLPYGLPSRCDLGSS